MEKYSLKGGTYAVFTYQGIASDAPKIMRYIFGEWLPKSIYITDIREHFETLPESYNPLDPQAKEDIWVPIKEKKTGTN
jgi:AraC family transcriptional regulator